MRHLRTMCLAAAITPPALQAQIEGRVVDTSGRALPGVEVEMLGPGGDILARGRTAAPDGTFDLAPEPAGRWIRASQFGFAPDSVSLDDIGAQIVLTLAPRAIPLSGFEIGAVGDLRCPDSNDRTAQAAWEALSERAVLLEPDHDRNPLNDVRWVARMLLYRQARGIGSDLPPFGEPWEGVASTSGAAQRGFGARPFGDDGGGVLLARPRVEGDTGGAGDAWILAGLHGPSVPRLFRRALGERADFGFSSPSVVTLCRTDARGVQLRASYQLEDGRATMVSWRLTTPEPVEHAGGWAEFDTETAQDLPLPSRAYMWHRTESGRNWHAYSVFGPWFVGVGDEADERRKAYESRGPG